MTLFVFAFVTNLHFSKLWICLALNLGFSLLWRNIAIHMMVSARSEGRLHVAAFIFLVSDIRNIVGYLGLFSWLLKLWVLCTNHKWRLDLRLNLISWCRDVNFSASLIDKVWHLRVLLDLFRRGMKNFLELRAPVDISLKSLTILRNRFSTLFE